MSWKRYPEERPKDGRVLRLAGRWNARPWWVMTNTMDLHPGDIWHPLPPVPSEEELSE